ncbi:MAG: type I restriction enzyme HsdR N-terminal domain-containing protein [Paludibacteraceae bacterium]|nr:type I restriction enzyme HsdR N-terminal domain-containing protein [Paludibacteraceae bacterium]
MRTRVFNGKEQIFCEWRHRWVRLTPEEWVRQHILHHMVEQLGYPSSLIAVEQAITVGDANKRCDAVVYDASLQPLMIIECKAETVPLTQKTLDQAITYNRKLNVPYLLLYNGVQTIFVNGNNIYPSGLPRYTDLLRCEQQ